MKHFSRLILIYFIIVDVSTAFSNQCLNIFSERSVSDQINIAPTALELEEAAKAAVAHVQKWLIVHGRSSISFRPAMLVGLWRKNGIFRDHDFWTEIFNNPESFRELLTSWYGKQYPTQVETLLASLPERLAPLALDISIVVRAQEFIRFAVPYVSSHPEVSIMELRAAFSMELGVATFYRAVTFSEPDSYSEIDRGMPLYPLRLNEYIEGGLTPRTLSFLPYQAEVFPVHPAPGMAQSRLESEMREWAWFLELGPQHDMYKRILEAGEGRFSQSISSFDYVALFAAKTFGRGDIALFELEIPILETVPANDITKNFGHAQFESNGQTFYIDAPGVEHFYLGTISAKIIKKITVVERETVMTKDYNEVQ